MTITQSALKGRRILVVEDDYFIVEDLMRELEQAGVEIVGPASSLDKAQELAQGTQNLSAAILDINVQGEMIFPLAEQLLDRGVPFVFLTGYDRDIIPERLQAVPRCEKPMRLSALVNALNG